MGERLSEELGHCPSCQSLFSVKEGWGWIRLGEVGKGVVS